MLHREISLFSATIYNTDLAYSENRTKHINALCGQNVLVLSVKTCDKSTRLQY